MAEFGVNATQLSQAQGAGSGPVAAVQMPVPAVVTGDAGLGQAVGNMANSLNLFSKDREAKTKAEAEALKQSVIKAYVNEQSNINNAIRQGTIKPTEGKIKSRIAWDKYSNAHSEYLVDLGEAAKILRGNSELGDVEDAVKADQAFERQAESAAQAAGYVFNPGMTPAERRSQVVAHQTTIKTEADFAAMVKRHQEERASGAYNQNIQDRESEAFSIQAINTIADTNFKASYDVVRGLATSVKAGTMTYQDAALAWDEKMKTIIGQIQSAAMRNPELAAPYRTLFADLQSAGNKLLDPTQASADAEDQVKLLLANAKLAMLQNPKVATVVATSQLFGQNAQLALAASPLVAEVIAKATSTNVDTGSPVGQIVGNPEVEVDTLGFLKKSMADHNKGAFKDPKAGVEIKNGIDNTLQQIGDALGRRGTDAKTLKNVADFVASLEFGQYASKNPLDAEALAAASKSFQIMYTPTVVKGITSAINTTVQTATGLVPNRALTGEKLKENTTSKFDPTKIRAVFTGSGVNFQFTNPSTNPIEARMEREVLTNLRQSQAAVNQLLRIGAHMEGTTNYSKFWEANKATFLPQFFTPEEKAATKPGEPAIIPEGSLRTEKAAVAFAQDTPTDVAASNRNTGDAANRIKQDIIAVKREMERATTPEIKAILERELKRLEGQ